MPSSLNKAVYLTFFLLITSLFLPCMAQEVPIAKLKTVVIDAGHGGKDAGALSPDKKFKEKDIVLDVALKLGKQISEAYPDVEVIYTRSKDVYLTLDRRSDIANKNQADLFISIHANSVKGTSSASGSETFVMGMHKNDENMEVCKAENSVITLEDDYTTTYQGYDPDNPESFIFFNLMQNSFFEQSLVMADLVQKNMAKGPITKNRGVKQGGLIVLWKTTMPSVLVELGFLSSATDRKVLTDKTKRTVLATRIFNAFEQFKKRYESTSAVEVEPKKEVKQEQQPETKPETKTETKPEVQQPKQEPKQLESKQPKQEPKQQTTSQKSGKYYQIQIFATSKKVKDNAPEFKGVKGCQCRYVNGLYKYSVGKFATKEEAQKALPEYKNKFKGAFIIFVEE